MWESHLKREPSREKQINYQKMNTSHTHLTALIERVLGNSQSDLILTEDGYDWAPKSNNWSTEYISLLDREGLLQATPTGEPDAEELAEWVRDNVASWISAEINATDDHDQERIVFLNRLLENI